MGEKIQEFSLGRSKFDVLIMHSGGQVEQAEVLGGNKIWKCGLYVKLGEIAKSQNRKKKCSENRAVGPD